MLKLTQLLCAPLGTSLCRDLAIGTTGFTPADELGNPQRVVERRAIYAQK
jgi:hypothetical protein